MPDGSRDGMDGSAPVRDAAARAADHAGIDRLTEELVPALIAKLGTTRLAELEVREGGWHVRLRRPVHDGVTYGRRASDRPSRSQPGHEGHGHAPGALEPHAPRPAASAATGGGPGLTAVGPGRGDVHTNGHGASLGGSHASHDPHDSRDAHEEPARALATSPAVGVFVPSPSLNSGLRVRAGDRLGIVDMLGVPQEVVSPVDGVVGATLVEAGTAVEYGQELVRIELAAGAEAV